MCCLVRFLSPASILETSVLSPISGRSAPVSWCCDITYDIANWRSLSLQSRRQYQNLIFWYNDPLIHIRQRKFFGLRSSLSKNLRYTDNHPKYEQEEPCPHGWFTMQHAYHAGFYPGKLQPGTLTFLRSAATNSIIESLCMWDKWSPRVQGWRGHANPNAHSPKKSAPYQEVVNSVISYC